MDTLVTALAETLATAYVRLCGWMVYSWKFPLGDDEIIVTVERRSVTQTPTLLYEETLLGVPV